MDTFTFGIILLLASFFVFMIVGQNLSMGSTVILGIYLLLMVLVSYFKKMPAPMISSLLGSLIGVIVGSAYKNITAKKKEA